ncbi:hypothetical protein MTO96_007914 [Rhipicephalus appendiculatus]
MDDAGPGRTLTDDRFKFGVEGKARKKRAFREPLAPFSRRGEAIVRGTRRGVFDSRFSLEPSPSVAGSSLARRRRQLDFRTVPDGSPLGLEPRT